jgi:hypothetical protein
MATSAATHPFEFWGCSEIRESLGVHAESERHLLERIEAVPRESIFHHTVRSVLRRRVALSSFTNDFAAWVAGEVRDLVLAERLSLFSPFDFPDIEAFREHLLTTLDDHLSQLSFAPRVVFGRPFHFVVGHLASVPLGVQAWTLEEFREGLARVDESSIYYHAVEGIERTPDPRNDLSRWVEDGLGLPDLAARIARLDLFVLSLSAIRDALLHIMDRALEHPA